MSLLAATLPTQQDLRGPGHWPLEAEHHCLVYIPQSMHARTTRVHTHADGSNPSAVIHPNLRHQVGVGVWNKSDIGPPVYQS